MNVKRPLLWVCAAISFAPFAARGAAQNPPAESKPASTPASRAARLAVGDKAPAFSVKDHTGKTRTLAELSGKRVVLFFYPKADTPGCTIESCGFRDRIRDFEKAGVVVLGASFDTEAENGAFAKKHSLPFALLCDVDKSLAVAYEAADVKSPVPKRHTIVIGADGKIERLYKSVSVKDHVDTVLADLTEKKR
jgi:peroxiredoxin Q/BCP